MPRKSAALPHWSHLVLQAVSSDQHACMLAGVVQVNGTIKNLAGQFVIADQPALTLTGSSFSQGTQFTSNAGSCLAGGVLVNSDSALYLDDVSFRGNNANGDRGGGAVLLYGNSTLHAVNSDFTDNAATASNLYAVDAAAMASGVRPSDDATPSLWCGAVGGVPGVDSLYGINDLASNHLLGGTSGKPLLVLFRINITFLFTDICHCWFPLMSQWHCLNDSLCKRLHCGLCFSELGCLRLSANAFDQIIYR